MEDETMEGSLSAEERVLIAQDVIATLRSRLRRLKLASTYLDFDYIPSSGQLTSRRIRGECLVCARGLMFLKSVDRYNHFDLSDHGDLGNCAEIRTGEEWGHKQADLIEAAFEGWDAGNAEEFHEANGGRTDRKRCLIAIMQNIVDNGGTFRPEAGLSPAPVPATEAQP